MVGRNIKLCWISSHVLIIEKIFTPHSFDLRNSFLRFLQCQIWFLSREMIIIRPFVSALQPRRVTGFTVNWLWSPCVSVLCLVSVQQHVILCQAEQRDSFFLLASHVIVIVIVINVHLLCEVCHAIILLCITCLVTVSSYQCPAR